MFYPLLFLSCVLIKTSHSHVVQAATSVNVTCIKYGSAHDCRFYSCFEERFPCGTSYWISNWGHKYCTRMKTSLPNFDATGRELLEKISVCITDKLLQQRFYFLKNINCEQLRVAGQKIVRDCYMTNAKLFCNAFKAKNRDCFLQLMDEDDRNDLSIIRTLTSVGQKCTPKKKLLDMRMTEKNNQCESMSTG